MPFKLKLAISLSILFSCQADSVLKTLFSLPKSMDESSGLAISQNLIWTLEDSNNAPEIYALDNSGKLARTVAFTDVMNHDWEDIASDASGNLYIGDTGNNHNTRKNLAIYKVNASDLSKDRTQTAAITEFHYPEQTAFPPEKSNQNFDCEAFFILNGNFYLFTKNRSVPYNGHTNLYQVPAKAGNFTAKKIGSFKTGKEFRHSAVTAADISPDGKTVALLTSKSVWLFTNFKGVDFFGGKARKIDLENFSQKEGMCFRGNQKLLICDERKKKNGGKVYELNLSGLKSKS